MYVQKKQMQEAAILYYEKKYTQQEIAKLMNLSRQTVSKLLNDAIKENIVKITIRDPEITCIELEQALCEKFQIKKAIVTGVSQEEASLCTLISVKKAAEYIRSIVEKGNQRIALSWGRTIQLLTEEFSPISTENNLVFPLFGATDQEQTYFLSNELARSFADKINAKITYAWFPYMPNSIEDCRLFQRTSYYKKINELWNTIDLAIVGIGNTEIMHTFGKIFGYNEKCVTAVGDISTHFFDLNGQFLELYENTLCASRENLKKAKETVAIACGKTKTEAISGALRTGLIDTFVTDEYTAKKILAIK